MERRELFVILGAAAVADLEAQQHHAAPSKRLGPYTPRFLSKEEAALVEALTEVIIPATEGSPGATEAGVLRYLDTYLLYAPKETQAAWRDGLVAVDQEAKSRFGSGYAALDSQGQDRVMLAMAENEGKRDDILGRFFLTMKRLSVEAYHYSPVHWAHNVKYKGNTAVPEFPGCTHAQHG